MDITKFPDAKLYQLCQEFGAATLKARREFLGLLPEVNRRRLWQVKGFSSVFEFAAKLAGVSEELVRRTLNIEKRIVDKPALHAALVKGEISINKLSKVISIATVENQDQILNITKTLSTRALETLARDNHHEKSVHVNTYSQLFADVNVEPKVDLKIETRARLSELAAKGIDIDAIICEALDRRENEIAREKDVLAAKQISGKDSAPKKASRHIPIKIRRILTKEHGKKCSISSCSRDSVTIHHTQRFTLTGNHEILII